MSRPPSTTHGVRAIPALGTQRRILALGCRSWSHTALARQSDLTKEQLDSVMRSDRVATTTADAVDELFHRLGGTRGPSGTRTVKAARAKGGRPPNEWRDPDEPDERLALGAPQTTLEARIEDLEWILRTDPCWHALTTRLGVSREAILAATKRAGRADLRARLVELGHWERECAI